MQSCRLHSLLNFMVLNEATKTYNVIYRVRFLNPQIRGSFASSKTLLLAPEISSSTFGHINKDVLATFYI